MRTSLLFTLLLGASAFGLAQNQPIDFEAGGNGADWTWTVFENDDNPAVEIIANPDQSGANTSGTVAQFTARQAGNPWAGCETNSGADLGPFVLSEANSTIKIMVWKPVISDVGIKLVSPTGWSQGEIKVPNTLINQWEEITFDFSAYVNPPVSEGQLSQIVVFPDFDLNGRTQDNVVYFDNITFNAASAPLTPAQPAPTPTQDPANVISMFSDAYSNVSVDTWRTDWSSAILTDLDIQGNPTKRYANLDFVGIETTSNQLDVTGMTHLHVDVWSADFTFFGIKLVDFGPDGAFGGGDDVEHQINFTSPAQGEWVSLDIPLSQFTGLTTQANIAQYILVGQPTGNCTVFMDNMYFYNGVVTPEGPQTAAPTPIHLAQNVISMFSEAYSNVPVDTWRTDWSSATLEDIQIEGNATKKYSNLDFVGIETVSNQINATTMGFIHLDIWSSNFTQFGIKLVDFGEDGAFGGNDDTEHQIDIPNPAQNEWVSLNLPLSDFTGLTARANLAQYILVGQPTGSATIYIDNVYFFTDPTFINDAQVDAKIEMYPNPASNQGRLFVNGNIATVELFDITGKQVISSVNSTIELSGIPAGVYVVRIMTTEGSVSSKRLIIE